MTKPRQGPLMPGEPVQLTDPKGRSHLITLRAGASFHTHRGTLSHDDIIGGPDGNVVRAQGGTPYVVFRPLLADFTLAMKRGAAAVYPKDAAQSLAFPDACPHAHALAHRGGAARAREPRRAGRLGEPDPGLARGGPGGPAAAPHGGSYRVPGDRAAAGARGGPPAPQAQAGQGGAGRRSRRRSLTRTGVHATPIRPGVVSPRRAALMLTLCDAVVTEWKFRGHQ